MGIHGVTASLDLILAETRKTSIFLRLISAKAAKDYLIMLGRVENLERKLEALHGDVQD
jgi:hypothetical protein